MTFEPGNAHLLAQRYRLLGGETATSGAVVDQVRALLSAADDPSLDIDAAVLGLATAVVGTVPAPRAEVLELKSVGPSGSSSGQTTTQPAVLEVPTRSQRRR